MAESTVNNIWTEGSWDDLTVDDMLVHHKLENEFEIVDSSDDIQISSKEDVSNDVVLRSKPVREHLNSDQCAKLFDEDGRLVKECKLRQALFEDGVDISWRHHIWKFIFQLYPFHSTYREQKTLDLENHARYRALHDRWVVLDKTICLPDEEPSSDPLEYLFSSEGEEEDEEAGGTYEPQKSKIYTFAEQVTRVDSSPVKGMMNSTSFDSTRHENKHSPTQPKLDFMTDSSCPYCNVLPNIDNSSLLDEEGRSLLTILELPSKVFATRQPVDLDHSYPKSKRVILRDVKRTDRTVHYFSHKRNLRKVHRILHIYAMFHPDIGYSQGMNDILARFLVVTNSEIDSYWMFCSYMEKKRPDFLEDTMMCKISLVKGLLQEVDEELFRFFEISECRDYLFCHRWLLLDFKREFNFADSLRLLEVVSSRYLELSSDRALIELDKVAAEEFEAEGGEVRAIQPGLNMEFTFDIFICIAILILNKEEISRERDAASVYGYLNSLCMNMNLNKVLLEAEKLFYKYCRQSVLKGFKEVDL